MTNQDAVQKDGVQEALDRVPAVHDPSIYWDSLNQVSVEQDTLYRHNIISATRDHPAHSAFDMLRTRLLQAMSDQGWTRVAITAPTRGCGSSFVTANLAFAVSRLEAVRSIVLDLDVRAPSLHEILGVAANDTMSNYLQGGVAPEDYLQRVGSNLAFGLNSEPGADSSETFQNTMSSDVLDELQDLFEPDLILFDMPPALEFDDVLAFLPNIDAVLVVAGGGVSTAEEVVKVEQILSEVKPVMGVMLNNASGRATL